MPNPVYLPLLIAIFFIPTQFYEGRTSVKYCFNDGKEVKAQIGLTAGDVIKIRLCRFILTSWLHDVTRG